MYELMEKELIFWGTGAVSKKIYNTILLQGLDIPVVCFIDNDISKKGKFLLDLPIKHAVDIKNLKTKDNLIVICSSFFNEISNQLNSLGYKESVDYISNYELYKYIEFLIAYTKLQHTNEIKLIVGANETSQKGWISTNQYYFDLLKKKDWEQFLKGKKVQSIVAEHVWEHLTYENGVLAAKHCYEHLVEGGRLRIAIPDGNHPNPYYIQWVKPDGYGDAADDHKELYTYDKLENMLNEAGFSRIEKLEYFDQNGNFHSVKWNVEDGYIKRSKDNDPRNWRGDIVYSSLIVDAIK